MDAQAALEPLQLPSDLTILSLSAPYLSTQTPDSTSNNNKTRTSTSSNENREDATPAILSADLAHYQDLFAKLRFSYVEQVTKERFLKSITAEQPVFVDAAENAALQEGLVREKAALKERKREVREIVEALEEQGRQLAGRYENIQLQTTQLESLPSEIANLEATVDQLRQSSAPKSDNPALTLPLQPTLELLSEREDELASINAQIETLQAAMPGKQAQVEQLLHEVAMASTRKIKAVEEAKEARRRRENGGMGDELEQRGRWLRGVETGLKTMLEV